ncbi:hypothetical protein DL93DRAFT_2089738 [Clavulina sp. PMI_390]|nr:hypothetical protein DL93DRAFT_2089738 [Clavulina sp. PMI_390]
MLFDLEPLRLGIEPLLKFSYQEYDKRPAYSIPNTNERLAHMQLQDVVLIELDATLDGISNLIHQLTLVHTAVKLRSDAIRNSMAPVSAIPTEVLHEISRIVVHDARFPQSGGSPIKTPQQTGSSGAVSSLSRVCKRWRAATLDLPELWTAVCMPWSSAVRAREMLLEYAKRARNLPLELSSWTPGNFLTKLPLDSSLAPRVVSATMLVTPEPCHWQDPDWSSPDWEESLSALEHATIIGHMQYPEQRVQFQDWVSKCRSMCLIDVRPNSRCWRKFQNLETLTLSQVDQYVLVDLSRKVECPNLRNLILLDITVRDEKQLRPGYPQPKKDKGAKIASGGHLDEGLVSLRIIGCDDEIMLLICDGWKLENLISFELRVRNYYSECVSEAKDCIRAFVSVFKY